MSKSRAAERNSPLVPVPAGRRWRQWSFRFEEKISRVIKAIRFRLIRTHHGKLLFVFGCQRSGTRVFCEFLSRLPDCVQLYEENVLTGKGEDRLRLLPADEFRARLRRFRHPLVCLKPLVESQRATELLDEFAESRAVWMVRDYWDVVNSLVQRHPLQVRNVEAIVNAPPGNWRSEKLSDETRAIVEHYYSPQMTAEDAAAVFWLARNRLFFEQQLDRNPKVMLVKYETFVRQPLAQLASLYGFLEMPVPRVNADMVDTRSLLKGRNVEIDPALRELCDSLLSRFEKVIQAAEGQPFDGASSTNPLSAADSL